MDANICGSVACDFAYVDLEGFKYAIFFIETSV